MEHIRHAPAASARLALAGGKDEGSIQALAAALDSIGITTLQCTTPTLLMERARTRQPALVVSETSLLDALPDGIASTLETLRNGPYTAHIPVVAALPAGSGETVELEWLRRGVDDAFVIPESGDLLQWRLRILAARLAPGAEPRDTLSVDGLTLDLQARKTSVDGASVALTRKEFDLLNMLLRKRGTVAYTTHLYHSVWGYGDSSPVDSHTVKVHISSLRSKLGPKLGRRIVNLPGLGYRFDG